MELEQISVVLRPRTTRESLDLGAAMLRTNARAVWSAWFAFSLPVFVLCNLVGVLLGLPWLGLLLVWWLKPLFDRLPLYVLSRAVFDRVPDWRSTLRGQRQWPWGSTIASLSWLRVDSSRALRLPLTLLEGLPSAQRAARWRVLRKHVVGDVSMLTWGCLQFELVFFLGVWLLAMMLVPHEWLPGSWHDFLSDDVRGAHTTWVLLANFSAYLSMSVIEPLYVACGFAIYLNRRTQLEAWDIDLAFRRLRQRLLAGGKVLAVLMLLGFGGMRTLQAAAAPAKPAATSLQQVFRQPLDSDDQRFTDAARETYADPRFGGEHTTRAWVLKHPSASPPQPQASLALPGFAGVVAAVMKLLLCILLAVAVLALLRFGWRWQRSRGQREARPAAVTPLREEVLAVAALPADLAAAVRQLWQADRKREALALLYRGCVEQAARALQLSFSADATEADWLRHASAMDDRERARRITAIVRTWQFAAYAGRYPDDAVVEQLLAGWPAQAERA
jgi:hypothetical protein